MFQYRDLHLSKILETVKNFVRIQIEYFEYELYKNNNYNNSYNSYLFILVF